MWESEISHYQPYVPLLPAVASFSWVWPGQGPTREPGIVSWFSVASGGYYVDPIFDRPFSRLVFIWLMPFLDVGFSRPLQIDGACIDNYWRFLIFKQDLWEFPSDLQASTIVNRLEGNFFLRCPPEQKHFCHSDNKYTSRPPSTRDGVKDADLENFSEDSSRVPKCKQKPVHDSSLMKALHQTFFLRWWSAGVLKLGSGALLYHI